MSNSEPETHTNLESIVECLVDDFTLAAEEFIFGLSKQLGLETVGQRSVEASGWRLDRIRDAEGVKY